MPQAGNPFANIKPNVVNENLEAHSFIFYGKGKLGKTTIASNFPKSVILEFERGGDCIPGLMRLPVNSWDEFENQIEYLKDPWTKENFRMIVIDTADKMIDLAKEKVRVNYNNKLKLKNTDKNGVVGNYKKADSFRDINDNGGEWEEVEKLVSRALDRIYKYYGYGIILIVHSKEKADPKNKEKKEIVFNMNERYMTLLNNVVDLVCYIQNEEVEIDGTKQIVPMIYYRGTETFFAGSRFKFIQNKSQFTYLDIENAIKTAIKVEKEVVGNEFFTDEEKELLEDPQIEEEFKKCYEYVQNITKFLSVNFKQHPTMPFDSFWYPQIQKVISDRIGEKKLSELTKENLTEAADIAREIQALVKRYRN